MGSRPRERVVLVGFMGSGKTTVGASLARLLGWGFLDMDQRIEERTGLRVARIFEERGEAAFREEEQGVAEEVKRLRRYVVAAGGGAFARRETREALQAGAVTVWLRCRLETVLQRLPLDGTRPLAANRETIRQLFAEREPSYRLADQVVDVDASKAAPEGVARLVLEVVGPSVVGAMER